MIRTTLLVVVALFPISEILLAFVKRSRVGTSHREDRGSMRLLWFVILLGVTLAFAAQWVSSAHVPVSRSLSSAVALTLMLRGLAVRWTAILTLGRFFTVDVAIQRDHAIVENGLYRRVRHPSYTGLLIAFLGFGVMFSNWLSLAGLLLPIVVGVLNRVAKEERALLASLGPPYESYRDRTKRFIPGIY